MANYDVIGNVVIVKFPRKTKMTEKKKFALGLLKEKKSVKTVLEKHEKFSGRLRTQKTRFLAGEKTKEALYKENGCIFRLNVDSCYFSPRLSSERKEIASKVRKGERVLVMFSGVGPFGIVVGKESRAKEVVCVELGKDCNKYARENVKRNKLSNVKMVQGDVKRIVKKISGKFDRIVMPRPNLKDSFLGIAFLKVKKSGVLHYYGFYEEKDKEKMKEMILEEAKKTRKKVKILRMKKAGEVGMRKFRYRLDIKVLN